MNTDTHPPEPGTQPPALIRAHSDAAFLALVPTLCGYRPEDSLLVIPFHKARCVGGMRLDLPSAPTHAVTNKVASLCISSFSRIRHCEAVALIAYTDLGHREAMKRFSPFLHRLEKAFMQQGFGIRNSFIQSASGWAEIDDNEAPATGWPLSSLDEERPAEADTSPVSHRELQLRDLDLPARDPGTAEQVEDALELLLMGHERNAFGVVIPAEELDQVDLIERLLSEEPENLKPATMARICSVAMIPALRDPMMVQMAFGAEVGRRAHMRTRFTTSVPNGRA